MSRSCAVLFCFFLIFSACIGRSQERDFPATAAIDNWKAISSYEVRFSSTESEFQQSDDGKSIERSRKTHCAIWVDRAVEKMVYLSKSEFTTQNGKKYAPCNFHFFHKGISQTKTNSGPPKKESMTFDQFVTIARVPIPELCYLGSFPTGINVSLSSFLDSLSPSAGQSYTQKRFEDGTILLTVTTKEGDGIEGLKSIFIDPKTAMPSKVSWKIGDRISESNFVESIEKNGIFLPRKLTAKVTSVLPTASGKNRTGFEDRETEFEWKSVNEPVQFPPWDEMVGLDPMVIDERFLKPYAGKQE